MRRILISVLTTFLLVSGLGAAGGRENVFAATPAYGAGVCTVSSAAYPTIASALTGSSCSTIQLKAQTYYEHGLVISRPLTIQGSGSFSTVIDAQHLDRALAVLFSPITGTATSPFRVTIRNLRIQNGNAEAAAVDRGKGGAVDAEGTTTLTLQNDDFRNNTGGALGTGGAVYQLNANFGSGDARVVTTVIGSTFEYNVAEFGGALESDTGRLDVHGSTFRGNVVINGGEGGAIGSLGFSLAVTGSDFDNNDATQYNGNGGAIYADAGAAAGTAGGTSLINDQFSGNTAGCVGGAIYHDYADLTVTGSNFTGNRTLLGSGCAGGGAIEDYGQSQSIANSRFQSNSAPNAGAIDEETVLAPSISHSSFVANVALDAIGDGGAIYTPIGGNFTDLNFSNNTAAFGGAIFNDLCFSFDPACPGVILNLNGGQITRNSAHYLGGGIYNAGAVVAGMQGHPEYVQFNIAGANGGGIYNDCGSTYSPTDILASNNMPNDIVTITTCRTVGGSSSHSPVDHEAPVHRGHRM